MESKPEIPEPGVADAEVALRQIQATLTSLEGDAALLREGNFLGRSAALEHIESGILDRLEGLLAGSRAMADYPALRRPADELRHRAEHLAARLEAADEGLFRRLRSDIRRVGCTGRAFKALIEPILGTELRSGRGGAGSGYDHLDVFFNGLLHSRPLPEESRPREPGMVFYQKTPARVILELAETAGLTGSDTFYDVGSGLGQVAMLIHLLTGAAARGIEVEPAYCGYARACAEDLGLRGVEFIPADARNADYAAGTVFFLYTPCEGRMLEDVLDRLRAQARSGSRVFTFGPCTAEVARRKWRHGAGRVRESENELGAFVFT